MYFLKWGNYCSPEACGISLFFPWFYYDMRAPNFGVQKGESRWRNML